MLKNTLILPEDDTLAAQLLNDAIAALDTILLLVFGADATAHKVVGDADQLANKTALANGGNIRRVVWIRAAGPAVRAVLAPILGGGPQPLVAALNFHDQVRATIQPGGNTRPIALEMAFLAGHSIT